MGDARRRAIVIATTVKWVAIIGTAFAPTVAEGELRLALFVLVGIGAVLRVNEVRSTLTIIGTLTMLIAAVVAAAVDGGPSSTAFGAVFLLAADVGVQRGGGAGGAIGVLGMLGMIGGLYAWGGDLALDTTELWVVTLTPTAGLAFGTVHRDLPITGLAAVRATTRVLDELVNLSERTQPGLNRWAVAEALVTGLREQVGDGLATRPEDGPHLLLADDGVLVGVGPPWDRRAVGLWAELPRPARVRAFVRRDRDDLPVAVAEELDAPRWFVHRFEHDGARGAVLVDARTPSAVLNRLVGTIGTAGLALANASRFERLQARAADAARARLAHDLHDGIAQALTHVRFELELLELAGADEGVTRARLAADAALLEVRRTIGELRDERPLVEVLRTHVDTVASFAHVELDFDVTGDASVPPDTASEIVRIAQEAISNALRHSGCSRIDVRLALDDDTVQLVVADNGDGIPAGARPGVGLSGINARARSIGGRATIEPAPAGGTIIALEAPTGGRMPEPAGAAPE